MAENNCTPKPGEANTSSEHQGRDLNLFKAGLVLGSLKEAARTPTHPRHAEAVKHLSDFTDGAVFFGFNAESVEALLYAHLDEWRESEDVSRDG